MLTHAKSRFGLVSLVKIYALFLVIFYLKMGLLNYTYYDQSGKLVTRACDFLQYYTASIFLRNGEASQAYKASTLQPIGEAVTGQKISRLAWNYPPTFFLIIYPLSIPPYPVSLVFWLLLTLTGYLFVLYRIAPDRLTFWLGISFPAAFMNINHGQNGFFFTSLLGGGFLLLNQFPIFAGILFGLFTCKPQFALLIPIALIAGRRWKVLGSMIVTTIAMIIISIAIFGWEMWVAFFDNMPFVIKLMETGSAPWFKMPTFFVASRMAGLSIRVSYVLQVVVIMSVVGIVYFIWSRKKEVEIMNSILVLGILLSTPYAFVHDFTMLAIPIAYLSWQGYTKGWMPYEKFLHAVGWHMPLFSMFIALFTPLQVGPYVLAGYLIFTLWVAYKSSVLTNHV